jgi:hypothetical protein
MISIAEGLGGVECYRGTAKDRVQDHKAHQLQLEAESLGMCAVCLSLASRHVTMATHACCHSNVLCIWLPDQNMYPRVL